jgi:polyhydroxyalkanoate synthesis regulator protein
MVKSVSLDEETMALFQGKFRKMVCLGNILITLDRSILITTEEHLINTEHAKTSELIGAGMAITDATLDRAKRDEKELAAAMKELEHLRHLVKYYQDTTQAVVYLRSEFKEAYNKFTDERHLFTARITELQEDNLMALAMCKDMERWYKKVQQFVERVDYIGAVQQGRDKEEHDIRC